MTLARVLCDSGAIDRMTSQVFSKPADYFISLKDCDSTSIPKLNFTGWFPKSLDNFFDK